MRYDFMHLAGSIGIVRIPIVIRVAIVPPVPEKCAFDAVAGRLERSQRIVQTSQTVHIGRPWMGVISVCIITTTGIAIPIKVLIEGCAELRHKRSRPKTSDIALSLVREVRLRGIAHPTGIKMISQQSRPPVISDRLDVVGIAQSIEDAPAAV